MLVKLPLRKGLLPKFFRVYVPELLTGLEMFLLVVIDNSGLMLANSGLLNVLLYVEWMVDILIVVGI